MTVPDGLGVVGALLTDEMFHQNGQMGLKAVTKSGRLVLFHFESKMGEVQQMAESFKPNGAA